MIWLLGAGVVVGAAVFGIRQAQYLLTEDYWSSTRAY